ncbi:MAG TPA: cupin domain-containing protein [Sporosarcina psychrophila]|uniref:Cupin domain-containing protein n=1 Tax=Sporosarcina psychrophila TaxID=1476 RepID=A0A921FVH1_SPOPS|nr:cupin domain-containing protein [Sporosarcina psychrophila]
MEKTKIGKKELEFTGFNNFESEPIPKVKGLSQKVITKIPGSDVATRILQFEPGTDTSPMGVQIHDFWEELIIIEGSIIDLKLNVEFKAGSVACRPPGMKHGPWKSPEGCKIYEVRYYSKGQ